jgi:N-acetylglucosamine malate deacetylase 1
MNVLCIAPHPDDETIGCGGTLLRHVAEGAKVHWLVVTEMTPDMFSTERMARRRVEIDTVADRYGFASVQMLGFGTTKLDAHPMSEVVSAMSRVFAEVQPNTVFVPYRNDVHSDHTVVFDAAIACCKSFRYPSVKSVYAYETLSETEFGLRPDDGGFRPNLFVDIHPYLDEKVNIMRLYEGEIKPFPFPRSEECLRAQALLRGAQSGVQAAEAFMILKEIR